jgi:hypothetical protein
LYGNIPYTDMYGHGFIHYKNDWNNYEDDWYVTIHIHI